MAGRPSDRARALGRELVAVHRSLRIELARVRRQLETAPGDVRIRPDDLRLRCAAFCDALTRHHTSEDRSAFPALRKQFPELGDVLTELEHDHVLIADILRRTQQLLEDFRVEDAEKVRRELNGLSAIMESHFQWEERRLVQAFDDMDGGRAPRGALRHLRRPVLTGPVPQSPRRPPGPVCPPRHDVGPGGSLPGGERPPAGNAASCSRLPSGANPTAW